MTLACLPTEVHHDLLLHMQLRHVFKLLCLNRAFGRMEAKVYWSRVAFHLLRRRMYETLDFVCMPYKIALDAFIAEHEGSIEEAVLDHLEMLENPENHEPDRAEAWREIMVPAIGNPRLICKLVIKEVVETKCRMAEMRNAKPRYAAKQVPHPTEFCIAERRGARAGAKMIAAVVDEPGLDAAAKKRILKAFQLFLHDVKDSRLAVTPQGIVVMEEPTSITDVPLYYRNSRGP